MLMEFFRSACKLTIFKTPNHCFIYFIQAKLTLKYHGPLRAE